MRFKPVIMIVLAVVFGGSAIAAGNSWLQRQAAQQRISPAAAPVPAATIVVAASPLRYGDEVTALKLRQIPWHGDALPPGAFGTIGDVTGPGEKRVALAAIEPNEPLLKTKVTGEGQRATLSTIIEDGMGAVTIQVDEVVGLAGLVLPGDRVDILATQQTSDGEDQKAAFTDRILRNVRVLAIGQTADERTDKPSVVRAVTIEVDQRGAQKIALAAKTSTLSLMLRKAGETASRPSRRVALGEIGDDEAGPNGDAVSIRVTRRLAQTSYAVPKSEAFAERNIAAPARRSVPVAQNTRSVNQVEASFFDR